MLYVFICESIDNIIYYKHNSRKREITLWCLILCIC